MPQAAREVEEDFLVQEVVVEGAEASHPMELEVQAILDGVLEAVSDSAALRRHRRPRQGGRQQPQRSALTSRAATRAQAWRPSWRS